jgi:hypothetical protein
LTVATLSTSIDANGDTVYHLGITIPASSVPGYHTLYIGLNAPVDGGFGVPASGSFTVDVFECSGQKACGNWECGTAIDNCGQKVLCGTCGDGTACKAHVCQCLGACL